eukprot:SRR837773.20831.p1 GENE.SRR837773.20831~~SRR837773.20831.p1  ORF type:complete len:412 (+),score=41.54 SRR837773.20831:35-1237(+)
MARQGAVMLVLALPAVSGHGSESAIPGNVSSAKANVTAPDTSTIVAAASSSPSPAVAGVVNASLRGAALAQHWWCSGSWSHNCKDTMVCCEPGFTCYEKTHSWAACLRTCRPNEEQPNDSGSWTCRRFSRDWLGMPRVEDPVPVAPPARPPPTLPPVAAPAAPPAQPAQPPAGQVSGGCSASWSSDCFHTKACCEPGFTCFEKNRHWAACRRTCTPDWDGSNDRWSCRQLSPSGQPGQPAAGPPAAGAPAAAAPPAGQGCSDSGEHCAAWATSGECGRNAAYMQVHCRRSCGQCGGPAAAPATPAPASPPACKDDQPQCPQWAQAGECGRNAAFMLVHCKVACGACGPSQWPVATPAPTPAPTPACEDLSSSCSAWMSLGECSTNPEYMLVECKRSCGRC